jgi:predicted RNA-binding protein YlxR (DUF448 family)
MSQKIQPRKPHLRRCTGCQEMKDKRSLIRAVRTEAGIELDETGKKAGRGAYICANPECFEKAYRQKGLERSFKQPVLPEVYEKLKTEMEKRVIK